MTPKQQINACLAAQEDAIKANTTVWGDKALRHTWRILKWLRENNDAYKSVDTLLREFPTSKVADGDDGEVPVVGATGRVPSGAGGRPAKPPIV